MTGVEILGCDVKGERFSRRMTRFIALTEHMGFIAGGGYNTKKVSGTLILEPHNFCDCGKVPVRKALRKDDRAKIADWLRKNNIRFRFKSVRA